MLQGLAEIFATIQEDPVAQVYLNRCYKDKDDIDANWNGVWILSEK